MLGPTTTIWLLGAALFFSAASPVRAARFRAADFKPYLGNLAKVRRAIEADRLDTVIVPLRRYLKRHRGHHQASFLLGLALMQAKRYADAETVFAALELSYPLLADYHRLELARAQYRQRKFAKAQAAAGRVSVGAVIFSDAQLVRADALRALGSRADEAAIWKAYLQRHRKGKRIGKAHMRLAEHYEHLGDVPRAIENYKALVVRAPLSKQRGQAESRLASLVAKYPRQRPAARFTTQERFRQALRYYRAMRNGKAEAGFFAVLRDRSLSASRRCQTSYYWANSVFKARARDRAEPMFVAAAKSCRKAKLKTLLIKSLYNRARGLMRKRKYKKAAAQFLAIEKEFPRHSYADDSRLRAAEAFTELNNKSEVTRLLSTLPKLHPDGDQARESLWRLARRAYLARDYAQALKYLDRTLNELGRARRYYAEGQALYWKARILARTRAKRRAAAKLFERCIREYPLSYYTLVSFNRLRELDKKRFVKLRRSFITRLAKQRVRWSFELGALKRDPYFKRGAELARLGLGRDAAREFARAGLSIARGTSNKRLWLAAALHDRAGIWRISHQVPRSRDSRFKLEYPIGDNYRRWLIAYPRAYLPHVQKEAKRNKIPMALVWAIMREESGFSPKIESYANAVGLMQMILPTARKAARRFGLRVNRRALHDPATNIKLGSAFLGSLFRLSKGTPPLAIAGYNAGYGAVRRWLKRFKHLALDEFVDRIPYDQTRRYTKRVLSSFLVYSVLYSGSGAPRIGLALPSAKDRKKKRPR